MPEHINQHATQKWRDVWGLNAVDANTGAGFFRRNPADPGIPAISPERQAYEKKREDVWAAWNPPPPKRSIHDEITFNPSADMREYSARRNNESWGASTARTAMNTVGQVGYALSFPLALPLEVAFAPPGKKLDNLGATGRWIGNAIDGAPPQAKWALEQLGKMERDNPEGARQIKNMADAYEAAVLPGRVAGKDEMQRAAQAAAQNYLQPSDNYQGNMALLSNIYNSDNKADKAHLPELMELLNGVGHRAFSILRESGKISKTEAEAMGFYPVSQKEAAAWGFETSRPLSAEEIATRFAELAGDYRFARFRAAYDVREALRAQDKEAGLQATAGAAAVVASFGMGAMGAGIKAGAAGIKKLATGGGAKDAAAKAAPPPAGALPPVGAPAQTGWRAGLDKGVEGARKYGGQAARGAWAATTPISAATGAGAAVWGLGDEGDSVQETREKAEFGAAMALLLRQGFFGGAVAAAKGLTGWGKQVADEGMAGVGPQQQAINAVVDEAKTGLTDNMNVPAKAQDAISKMAIVSASPRHAENLRAIARARGQDETTKNLGNAADSGILGIEEIVEANADLQAYRQMAEGIGDSPTKAPGGVGTPGGAFGDMTEGLRAREKELRAGAYEDWNTSFAGQKIPQGVAAAMGREVETNPLAGKTMQTAADDYRSINAAYEDALASEERMKDLAKISDSERHTDLAEKHAENAAILREQRDDILRAVAAKVGAGELPKELLDAFDLTANYGRRQHKYALADMPLPQEVADAMGIRAPKSAVGGMTLKDFADEYHNLGKAWRNAEARGDRKVAAELKNRRTEMLGALEQEAPEAFGAFKTGMEQYAPIMARFRNAGTLGRELSRRETTAARKRAIFTGLSKDADAVGVWDEMAHLYGMKAHNKTDLAAGGKEAADEISKILTDKELIEFHGKVSRGAAAMAKPWNAVDGITAEAGMTHLTNLAFNAVVRTARKLDGGKEIPDKLALDKITADDIVAIRAQMAKQGAAAGENADSILRGAILRRAFTGYFNLRKAAAAGEGAADNAAVSRELMNGFMELMGGKDRTTEAARKFDMLWEHKKGARWSPGKAMGYLAAMVEGMEGISATASAKAGLRPSEAQEELRKNYSAVMRVMRPLLGLPVSKEYTAASFGLTMLMNYWERNRTMRLMDTLATLAWRQDKRLFGAVEAMDAAQTPKQAQGAARRVINVLQSGGARAAAIGAAGVAHEEEPQNKRRVAAARRARGAPPAGGGDAKFTARMARRRRLLENRQRNMLTGRQQARARAAK